jgi:hypothetical protein
MWHPLPLVPRRPPGLAGLSIPGRGATVDTNCDRCPAPARYRYERGEARLTLCGRHGAEHGQELRLGGWFTYRIGETVKA